MHIVYNLVTDVLGGEIRLQSIPAAGTSFTLLLPLVAPHISLESDVIAIQ
jgi:signal transduction histidine kinase